MVRSVLPMRFRVLHYASKKDVVTYHDLLKDLAEEYVGEGQFNKNMMQLHLDSLRAVGMLEEVDVVFEDNGELLVSYRITDYGRERLKYLPLEWQ